MDSCRVYGLGVCTEIPLYPVPFAGGSVDIKIRRAALPSPPLIEPILYGGGRFWKERDDLHVRYAHAGRMALIGQRAIEVDPSADADPCLLNTLLLYPLLGIVMQRKGHLVLHGACVAVGGRAALILGWSGAGKSTLAAALYERGHRLLADDVVVIADSLQSRHLVLPGVPQIRLNPDSAQALGYDPASLPPIHSHSPHRVCMADREFPDAPVPLGNIYVLEEGDSVCLEVQSGLPAFQTLAKHQHFEALSPLIDPQGDHLHRCGALVRRAPVKHLRRPTHLGSITEVAELVERDMLSSHENMPTPPQCSVAG